MAVSHIRYRSESKTLCGRTMPPRRIHQSWPTCKTCERLALKSGSHRAPRFYDADGWLLPQKVSANVNFTVALGSWTITPLRTEEGS